MNFWMDVSKFLNKMCLEEYLFCLVNTNYFDTIFTIYKMALLIAFIDCKFPLLLPDTCYISFLSSLCNNLDKYTQRQWALKTVVFFTMLVDRTGHA